MHLASVSVERLTAANISEVLFARIAQSAAGGASNATLIIYLMKSFHRARLETTSGGKAFLAADIAAAKQIIINYSCTVLLEPEFTGSSSANGAIDLLTALQSYTDRADDVTAFLDAVAAEAEKQEDDAAQVGLPGGRVSWK